MNILCPHCGQQVGVLALGRVYHSPYYNGLCWRKRGFIEARVTYLNKHQYGEHGTVSPDEQTANQKAKQTLTGHIISRYPVGDEQIVIVTLLAVGETHITTDRGIHEIIGA